MCGECNGAGGRTPISVVVCKNCLYLNYQGRHPEPRQGDAERTRSKLLLSLVSGRQRVLAMRKRSSTREQYRTGIEKLLWFLELVGLRVEYVDHEVLMDYVVWLLVHANYDSSTIRSSLQSVHDLFEYVRRDLGLDKIPNPVRHPLLREFLTTVGANFKKPSQARVSIPLEHAPRLLAVGLSGESRKQRHLRLFYIFLTLGMLRNNAAGQLRVFYEVDILGRVRLLPESDVQALTDATGLYLRAKVDVDKNVTAETERFAYLPECPYLGVNPAVELFSYLRDVRPPSGGYLFAEPHQRGTAFSVKPFKGFGKPLKHAYLRAYPLTDPAFVSRLGSHSGRKSLAQWLWEAGWSKRLIADAGGWFIKREAVDLYFATSPEMILTAIRTLGSAPRRERPSD